MLETIGEVFPEAKYQRCIVHFYRNVFSVVPSGKMRSVVMMLKAIHAQESKEAETVEMAGLWRGADWHSFPGRQVVWD